MKSPRSVWCGQLAFISLILVQSSWLVAQEVTLKREAISIADPKGYQVPLRTVPAKVLEIVAPADGVIQQVLAKPGTKVLAQGEACSFDDEVPKLLVAQATANLAAAKAELKIAQEKKVELEVAIAQAHVDAATAGLKLVQRQLDQTSIKTPFAGELLKVDVIPGQFVRAGQRLMTLVDTSSMLIEIPVDRSLVKVGSEIEISIEKTPVKAKVHVILPAEKSFEPLRNLIHNLATAVVQVENSKSEFYAGQTVFTKVIPQHPFGSIPTAALQNQGDGNRKVQILRQGVVRDISVQELTQAGPDRLFVAGAFAPDDEVIITSTTPLKDGQLIRSRTVAAVKPEGDNPTEPATTKAAAPASKTPKPPAF